MARLTDFVSEIVSDLDSGKTLVDIRGIVCARWSDIDSDGQYIAGIEGVTARIKDAAKKVTLRSISKIGDAQEELPFDIPGAVAMDIEGRQYRPTRDLSRDEFVRAIEIREQQIENDRRKVREWKAGLKAADRYWSKNPTWTFGQCLDAIMARKSPSNDNAPIKVAA